MAEPDYRALLIEALARLQALDMLPGDPGGPFHVRDVNDLEMTMRWIEPVRTDPPSWGGDEPDPLIEWADVDTSEEIDARAMALLSRLREHLTDYHRRRGDAGWRGWWRGASRVEA